MSYHQFYQALKNLGVFSVQDITKAFPGFDSRRLFEWQEKGYLTKIVNKKYLFNDIVQDELTAYRIGNVIHSPSYVSLQSALAFYHLIPEAVFTVQLITTNKTVNYNTPIGDFRYRSVKPSVFFGYSVIRKKNFPVLMAEPEKAVLDLLYLTATIKTHADIEALRINQQVARERIDVKKIKLYSRVFNNGTLSKRLKLFNQTILHADLV